MSTYSFPYVEDYIEFIGGYRDLTGKSHSLFDITPCPLQLARYDLRIINSLCVQTADLKRPYTDRQAELAIKIILNYSKQLNKLQVELPAQLNKFRYGIREVDRTKKIYLEDGKIILKFPYDTNILSIVKKCIKENVGSATFDNESKFWKLGLTEPALNWSMTMASINGFIVDEELQSLYNALLETEKTPFNIELRLIDNKFTITNAADSLISYIETQLGGFAVDNILRLVDSSSVLGYTVSNDISKTVKKQYPNFWKIISKKNVKLDKNEYSIESLIEYAKLTDRLPIYLYDTQLPYTDTDEVKYLNLCNKIDLAPKLLVTKTSMMIGPKKQAWKANSDKIVILE